MSLLNRFSKITTFVLDVDGVLTDGSILLLEDGQMARSMNTKDGYAMQLAIKKGYRIVIISGGASEAVTIRLTKLGIKDVFLKVENKIEILHDYMNRNGIKKEEILYMGDDIPDYEVMKASGIACAPSDAVGEIKHIAAYISPLSGGRGCVRDVIEKVMKLRGDWHIDVSLQSR
ncbi:KdsC family phosphatase [Pinibacter soli]|uniref:HAD hydrolase family protein n=1 Tax=Pinibacter soli TaxID=3044211 RepID=A0ABT6RGR9_9BACT|nr:HAD hydrolase family protein [Pinibacter soli]MDI3321059.1 HAD hydrolase family protein [Pinibacter soli]